MKSGKLLIVDDDDGIRTQMKWAFADDYEIVQAQDRASAMAALRQEKPAVVTLDLGLPPRPDGVEEGLQTLDEIVAELPGTKVIVITGHPDRNNALQAIARGAHDFYTKPIDLDEFRIILRQAFHVHRLEQENRSLQLRLGGAEGMEGIIGHSPQMQVVFDRIRRVAATDASVLIYGASGTGKELVSRAIHNLSERRSAPFVAINCGAIPENLLESELFGHEKGAFTGANAQVRGKVEYANRGTLFLDEIGEMPMSLQVKLLRFLQERVIERVGGRQSIEVDVRVVAATNQDLEQMIQQGRFREDLYYRLSVVSIRLPNLREREGDLLLLARAMLQRHAASMGKKVNNFSKGCVDAMGAHPWPGNVRELENRVKRGVILANGNLIEAEDMELKAVESAPATISSLRSARDQFERAFVIEALQRNNGNISQTATEIEVSRPSLYDLINKHKIQL